MSLNSASHAPQAPPCLGECPAKPQTGDAEDGSDAGEMAPLPTPTDYPTTTYDQASWLQRLLNTWLNGLLKRGRSRPLVVADIEPVPLHYASRFNWRYFRQYLSSHEHQSAHQGPSAPAEELWRPLWRAYGRQFVVTGTVRLAGDVTGTAAPKMLNYLLTILETRPGASALTAAGSRDWWSYFWCFVLFGLFQLNTLAINGYFQMTMQLGFRCRVALQMALYRQALRLAPHQRATSFDQGRMANLIGGDGARVERSIMFLHYVWSGPLQIVLTLAYLWSLLGWVALVGFGTFCVLYPVQSWLVRRMVGAKNGSLALTDARVHKMQEVVAGMRLIKLCAWEEEFLRQLERLRAAELGRILRLCLYRAFITFLTTMGPVLSCVSTFAVYYAVHGGLPVRLVLPAIAYFNALRLPLALLPMVFSMVGDAVVALRRMQSCLSCKPIGYSPPSCRCPAVNAVECDGAVLSYRPADEAAGRPDSKDPRRAKENLAADSSTNLTSSSGQAPAATFDDHRDGLHLGSFSVKHGELVAVVGPTGAGKSSLLNALIGEMALREGALFVSPSKADDSEARRSDGFDSLGARAMAYCPQTAWIRNCSLRDNILQGQPLDAERYSAVIDACQLRSDLHILPHGDATPIGDRGANLSGGQRHRVSLARAAYSQAPLILADDPLAALDASVRRRVWHQLFCGLLVSRTRIVCTHDDWLLSSVDHIIVLQRQRVVFAGTYAQYRQSPFLRSINTHSDSAGPEDPERSVAEEDATATSSTETKSALCNTPSAAPEEDRATGKVSRGVYRAYFWYCGGWLFIAGALGTVALQQLCRVADSWWIAHWEDRNSQWLATDDSASVLANFIGSLGDWAYFGVYAAWGMLQGFFSLLGALVFTAGGLRSARRHHQLAARGVLYAPVVFVEHTPSGRILNRFSRDLDALDSDLPEDLRSFVSTLGFVVCGFVLIAVASVKSLFCLVPLVLASYAIQRHFRCSLRELKRLEAVSRSPLYSNLAETYEGLTSIKAYRLQPFFVQRHERAVDDVDAVSFVLNCMQRWVALRLETVGNVAVLVCALFVCASSSGRGVAGVALVYSLSISGSLNWSLRQFAEAEGCIVSSERLLHYGTQLPSEEAKMTVATTGNADDRSGQAPWPSDGEIVADNVSLKYGPGALALDRLSFHIRPREKVGVVGRTGAGKSSLIAALYRLYEYESDGTLCIDGIECRAIGLRRLRRALTIIPQDPVVFSGTLRSNLDPLGLHADERLWHVLRLAHLHEVFWGGTEDASASGDRRQSTANSPPQDGRPRCPITLDSQVGVDVTLSTGQRQLLCLARALLHRTPIVVLDEATANIDPHTDTLVQECVQREFAACTVITIAHRLQTILHYDRVFVMHKGRIIEQGPPRALLHDPATRFHQLGREMGLTD